MAFYNNNAHLFSFMVMKYLSVSEKDPDKLGVLEGKLLHFYDIRVPLINGNTVFYEKLKLLNAHCHNRFKF